MGREKGKEVERKGRGRKKERVKKKERVVKVKVRKRGEVVGGFFIEKKGKRVLLEGK